MSLDVSLYRVQPTEVFDANITHNLARMADAAGIYGIVWRPEENDIIEARQLVEPLTTAIQDMVINPDRYKELDAKNGWGTYDDFLPWLIKYRDACAQFPDAEVRACR